MKHYLIGGLLLALPLVATPAVQAQSSRAPAQQAAVMPLPTAQYVAMGARGGSFLEETSRIAYEKASDPQVKRFARAEVFEQVRLAEKLNANTAVATGSTGTSAGGLTSSPAGSTLAGAGVGALVGGPVGALVGAGVGATTGSLSGARGGQTAPAMTTDAQKAQMLAQLQSTPAGPEFDALYVQAQIMGHQEAYAIHGGYAQAGEDPALRRTATQATKLIRQHLSQLNRLQSRV